MAKYKAYPEYKDSGMEWCIALPVGWKRTNLRWLSSIYAGGTPSKNVIDYWENGTVPWINSGAVNQSYITEPSTFISKAAFENSNAKWIPKGALVVALAGQGKTKGMVAQLGINTTCNQSMAAIVFYEKNLSRYIYWWLTSNYQNMRNMAGGDLRDGLNLELLGDIQCPQPNDGECIRISAFLDHETAKIDNLIEKQQQLIELLKEKRQAVISHAVTKGLNPDVVMKDSGVEWLGEVPEHWIIAQLKFNTLEMQTGPFGSQLHAEDYVVDGIPLINPAHMNAGMIIPDPKVTVDEATQERLGRHKLSEGEIIFSRRGELGRCAVVKKNNEGWLCGTGSLKAKLTKKIIPDYAYTLISSEGVVSELTLESKGSTMANLNTETLGRIRLPVPPISEQEEILDYIKIISNKYDYLIRSADTAIRLMQERRTALISAAVTGKIDVRDWVAPDTQDAEEPQEATA
ncbi:restriction endonuclease subunit S [Citrobacter sp. Cb010]|jgi:type I restriction enzyme S subunit|uniref:restriction endonuclease subunit S n=1 Tax=Citrobacter TaxID=544 RepID=UPI002576059F|nr:MULTISPECIES: restriction endonuclease subunit S [unclassified Citrobacter]MDM3374509.1 restriction endonuclease subunit S [Citrobacter sp. Cb010]MDM3457197.1 restriction endonuclease subunit S [Citrobacter sp. Cb036]